MALGTLASIDFAIYMEIYINDALALNFIY